MTPVRAIPDCRFRCRGCSKRRACMIGRLTVHAAAIMFTVVALCAGYPLAAWVARA